jgi:hypothetical protein
MQSSMDFTFIEACLRSECQKAGLPYRLESLGMLGSTSYKVPQHQQGQGDSVRSLETDLGGRAPSHTFLRKLASGFRNAVSAAMTRKRLILNVSSGIDFFSSSGI